MTEYTHWLLNWLFSLGAYRPPWPVVTMPFDWRVTGHSLLPNRTRHTPDYTEVTQRKTAGQCYLRCAMQLLHSSSPSAPQLCVIMPSRWPTPIQRYAPFRSTTAHQRRFTWAVLNGFFLGPQSVNISYLPILQMWRLSSTYNTLLPRTSHWL